MISGFHQTILTVFIDTQFNNEDMQEFLIKNQIKKITICYKVNKIIKNLHINHLPRVKKIMN
jgi:hypothetical protein